MTPARKAALERLLKNANYATIDGTDLALLRRMEHVGLVRESFAPMIGAVWNLTPAGLAAARQAREEQSHD